LKLIRDLRDTIEETEEEARLRAILSRSRWVWTKRFGALLLAHAAVRGMAGGGDEVIGATVLVAAAGLPVVMAVDCWRHYRASTAERIGS